jgi:hypothetical protein
VLPVQNKYNERRATQFICVDSSDSVGNDDKVVASSSADNSHASNLYPTEARGSVPGYADNKEITCAQCSSSTGPTYVRWGRTTCPTAATLVYNGYTAGTLQSDTGGGYNYICLHNNPDNVAFSNNANSNSATIYRVEYETSTCRARCASPRAAWRR